MKKTFKTLMTVAALAAVSLPSASAAALAEYAFTGGSASATSADANVTANDFTIGSGLTTTAGFSGSGNNAFARSTGTFGSIVSFANASANDDYFSVTIGPNYQYEMNLDSLTFDYGYNSNFSDGGTLRAYVTTSDDSHAAFESFFTTTATNGTSTTTFPISASVDLTGAEFQSISSDTEFRIYLSDEYFANAVIHRIDNVTLNGTVNIAPNFVPEPSSTALLGLGGLALALRRRRS
jgi:hypothetical protein